MKLDLPILSPGAEELCRLKAILEDGRKVYASVLSERRIDYRPRRFFDDALKHRLVGAAYTSDRLIPVFPSMKVRCPPGKVLVPVKMWIMERASEPLDPEAVLSGGHKPVQG